MGEGGASNSADGFPVAKSWGRGEEASAKRDLIKEGIVDPTVEQVGEQITRNRNTRS